MAASEGALLSSFYICSFRLLEGASLRLLDHVPCVVIGKSIVV